MFYSAAHAAATLGVAELLLRRVDDARRRLLNCIRKQQLGHIRQMRLFLSPL